MFSFLNIFRDASAGEKEEEEEEEEEEVVVVVAEDEVKEVEEKEEERKEEEQEEEVVGSDVPCWKAFLRCRSTLYATNDLIVDASVSLGRLDSEMS